MSTETPTTAPQAPSEDESSAGAGPSGPARPSREGVAGAGAGAGAAGDLDAATGGAPDKAIEAAAGADIASGRTGTDHASDADVEGGAETEDGPPAPAPPRRRGWRKVLAVGCGVLAVVVVATLTGGKLLLDRYTGNMRQQHLLGGAGVEARHGLTAVQGPINILLAGVDARGNPGEAIRSDSIIILHVPASHDRAYLISIPRDAEVEIPAFPRTGFDGGTAKIDAAFAYGSQNGGGRQGGFELLAQTIKNLTGIGFNAGAIIDFGGFRSVVAAMGGVYMCVDEQVTSIHIGIDENGRAAVPYREYGDSLVPVPGVTPQVYKPGCQQMQAWQALDYVRQRKLLPDGDYGRTRHQQQFLEAMFEKATSRGVLTNPGALDSVLRAAGAALTVDLNGVPISNWLFTMRSINDGGLTLVKTNAGEFNSFWVGDELRERLTPDSMALFESIRTDTVDGFLATHPTWITDPRATTQPTPDPTAS